MLSAVLYWLVYALNRRLYDWVIESTRDATAESTVLAYSLVAFGVTAFLLILIHVGFGYAKVAVIVEGRVSMLAAALRGIAFTLTHPFRTLALALFFGVLALLGLMLYGWIAPDSGGSTLGSTLYAFALGQLEIAGFTLNGASSDWVVMRIPKEGPIKLQHHGDTIQFANIYIKELD